MSTARVLIVEDDTDLREFLLAALPHYGGFQVTCAADGIQGLIQAVEAQPDCMVIDVKMPGLDGYQLVRALRGDPATATIPLIILTALAQDRDRFTGMASGADRFAQKPIRPRELADIILAVMQIDEQARHTRLQLLLDDEEPQGGETQIGEMGV